jgi:GNAT superfamily N-acetyltransferase
MPDYRVRRLAPEKLPGAVERLSEILIDTVASGAGVSFMHPLSRSDARAYWTGLIPGMAAGELVVVIAEDDETIVGTVQLHRAWPPNQPHRGDIAKLLVHRDFRRRGIGAALMKAADAEARDLGITLLTFDAVAHGDVERFYRNLGYNFVGVIPGYAYSGQGQLDDTAIFYKRL